MNSKTLCAAIGAASLALAPAPLLAQDHHDHSGHQSGKTIEKTIEKQVEHGSDHHEHMGDMPGAGAVLEAYRDALVRLDLEAAGATFAEESQIFENGKAEGSWANYADNHLGPELGEFHSFTFPTYDLEVRQEGHFAFGTERYTYVIELHDGRKVEREGVATSVLRHGNDGWKIVSYHSSSRAPRR